MTWKTALVTGASAGIGREFAQQLARAGTNLVLVARSEDMLGELARGLAEEHGISAEVLVADLTRNADLEQVARRVRDAAAPVDLLVNNAGFGTVGPLRALPPGREMELVALNAGAVLRLSRAAAEAMTARGSGTILNVASLAGYVPIPYFSTYSATKAFVLHLSLGLREELRGTGVSVTALAPGFVDTDFVDKAGVRHAPLRRFWSDADRVARAGLAGAARGQAVVLPGLPVRVASIVSRLTPPSASARVTAATARRFLGGLVQQSAANASAAPAGPPPEQTIHLATSDRAVGG